MITNFSQYDEIMIEIKPQRVRQFIVSAATNILNSFLSIFF